MDNRSLSFLASQSAVFLECYANGIDTGKSWSIVDYFSEEMDYISKNQSIKNSDMLLRFVWPNSEDWKGRALDDVYLRVNLLAKDLKHFKEFPKKKQHELIDICLRLSTVASKYDFYDRIYDRTSSFGLVV